MMKIIAEVKKASPHDGVLNESFVVAERVKEYERLGASVISIVTAKEFQGDKAWITQAAETTRLPILMKDFITTEEQLAEAAILGANWILLIADLLTFEELDYLTFRAWKIGLKPIVEVYSLASLRNAIRCDVGTLLINNRNLRDGTVKLTQTFNLLPLIPDNYEIISASGYDESSTPVLRVLRKLQQIDYLLIGKVLMQSDDLERTFKLFKND